jgi:predicted small secreted protein
MKGATQMEEIMRIIILVAIASLAVAACGDQR